MNDVPRQPDAPLPPHALADPPAGGSRLRAVSGERAVEVAKGEAQPQRQQLSFMERNVEWVATAFLLGGLCCLVLGFAITPPCSVLSCSIRNTQDRASFGFVFGSLAGGGFLAMWIAPVLLFANWRVIGWFLRSATAGLTLLLLAMLLLYVSLGGLTRSY